jgi:hypothetical protein
LVYFSHTIWIEPRRLKWFVLLLALGLVGCELIQPPPEPDVPRQTISDEESALQREVEWLLDEALLAFRANRLTTPLNDNAYYRYLRVMSLDPDNAEAKQGITDIVEKYLDWAMQNAVDGRFRQATNYLNKARSVDETHPNIVAVERYIDEHQSSEKLSYPLALDGLKERAAWLAEQITEIGRAASHNNAFVVIVARNDAEGRWIYQQLNKASADRIRARIELGRRPAIHMRY